MEHWNTLHPLPQLTKACSLKTFLHPSLLLFSTTSHLLLLTAPPTTLYMPWILRTGTCVAWTQGWASGEPMTQVGQPQAHPWDFSYWRWECYFPSGMLDKKMWPPTCESTNKQEDRLEAETKMKEEEQIDIPRIAFKMLDLLEVEVQIPWIPFWSLITRSINTFFG